MTKRFHSLMQGLVDGMRTERPAESSIAAHLLDIKDPDTGAVGNKIKSRHLPVSESRGFSSCLRGSIQGFRGPGHHARRSACILFKCRQVAHVTQWYADDNLSFTWS